MSRLRATSPAKLLLLVALIESSMVLAPPPVAAATPQTSIVAGPSGAISSTSATFRFKSTLRASTFQCRIDAKAWSKCTSPKTYSGLGQGPHTFRVRASKGGRFDASPAVRSFTVDTIKPETILDPPLSARIIHRIFVETYFSSNEAGTFECRLHTSTFAPCTSPYYFQDLLTDRTYTFQVRAKDAAGNVDASPASWGFGKVSQLSYTQETGDRAAEYFFPDELSLDVPSNCDPSPAIDCPGGSPVAADEQLSVTSTRSVLKVDGTERYDLDLTMDVDTLQPFHVEAGLYGCMVTLDSGSGSSPTWTYQVSLSVDVHPHQFDEERYLIVGDGTLGGVESSDYTLSNSPFCPPGVLPTNYMVDLIEGVFRVRMHSLCMAPGPLLFEPCPWVDV